MLIDESTFAQIRDGREGEKKEKAWVACAGKVDRRLLRSLASSPEHYKDLRSPFELRRFLAQVGSTVTTLATDGESASTVRRGAFIGKAA